MWTSWLYFWKVKLLSRQKANSITRVATITKNLEVQIYIQGSRGYHFDTHTQKKNIPAFTTIHFSIKIINSVMTLGIKSDTYLRSFYEIIVGWVMKISFKPSKNTIFFCWKLTECNSLRAITNEQKNSDFNSLVVCTSIPISKMPGKI